MFDETKYDNPLFELMKKAYLETLEFKHETYLKNCKDHIAYQYMGMVFEDAVKKFKIIGIESEDQNSPVILKMEDIQDRLFYCPVDEFKEFLEKFYFNKFFEVNTSTSHMS
jgi:hypothetical protein